MYDIKDKLKPKRIGEGCTKASNAYSVVINNEEKLAFIGTMQKILILIDINNKELPIIIN